MPLPKRVCRGCGEQFVLLPNKPGNINDCSECAVEIVRPYMAKVSYPSKNASEVQIEITQNCNDARRFNNSQKHHWSRAYQNYFEIVEKKS